eukprot:TRINITY_DN1288_c0_g1_i13.p2 TRINITY_DN1288_c0_g1~~TRINITY_DN1288_c0_g1_i13.p2  ORF type:complete len:122 (+),score=15.28 TRINITY_DN1288_c0_g1_i13:1-366(+)
MEILRRMHLRGAHQFFMSTNRVIYLPFSEMWFYRRALDYRKMLDLELVSVPEGSSVDKEEELHKITESALIPGMRLMAKEDVPKCTPCSQSICKSLWCMLYTQRKRRCTYSCLEKMLSTLT